MTEASERSFVALAVPAEIGRSLAAFQPDAGAGIRLNRPDDMHITLHFLGLRQTSVIREALASVEASAFIVHIANPGSFLLRGKRCVLWVGVEPDPALLALHAATAGVLAGTGFRPETRAWVPHVTLARLGPNAPSGLAGQFEQQQPVQASFACESFTLYSSETRSDGARYRAIERWPLSAV